jgi:hypothetical protein
VLEQRLKQSAKRFAFEPAQALPYLLVVGLFCILAFNVLAADSAQRSIRPVLVIATMLVVGLVLVRQILTILDNTQLLHKEKATLREMERLNQSITQRTALLEAGITHLKETQARLANGDVRTRASIPNGELWPLAVGLNLMADRMMRVERNLVQAQKLGKIVDDLSQALVRARSGKPFVLPPSALEFPEICSLLIALDLEVPSGNGLIQLPAPPNPPQPLSDPITPLPTDSDAPSERRSAPTVGGFLKNRLKRYPDASSS